MSRIVLEDFNDGNGCYKVNLAELNKEQVEEIENLVKKWNPELEESDDERIRKGLLYVIEHHPALPTEEAEEYIAWLEKQGEQNPALSKKGAKGNDKEIPNSEPPLTIKHAREVMGIKQDTAWSEEDEVKINRIVACLENLNVADNDILLKDVAWLKSIKDRVQPQPKWKPSDEQMHYLNWIANVNLGDSVVEQEVSKHLNELLEDLKKLRDE